GQPDRYRLAPLGLPNVRSDADGFIRFEFSESFDDFPGVADGMWESGVIVLYGGVLTPTPCPGDIDINCEVGFSDLTSVLKWWGVSGPGIPGDTNGDQHINLLDVSIIFANWGLKCGPQLVNVQRVPRERSGPRPRREDEALGADTTVPPFFTVVE
ncbi:MAG: hypothetical protein JNK58_05775, partial [Phycisphaerae bacterium]|nr:hypothetical protein [Phycisphaerae bacterium]